jgi:integrase
MTVYKKANGYQVDVYVDSVRVARKSFSKKADAQNWHDSQRAHWLTKDHAVEKKTATRFSDIIDQYQMVCMSKLSAPTARRYQGDIAHIRGFFSALKPDKISPLHFERFQAELLKKGLSEKSVNHVTDTLRTIISKANSWRLCSIEFSLVKLKVQKASYRWWDDRADIEAFLLAAKNYRYYPMYAVALETGMRLSEIVALHKDKIDFNFGQITVDRQWLEKEACYGPTKSRRIRYIDFDPNSFLGQTLADAVKKSTHKSLVFSSLSGEHVSSDKLARKYMHAIIKKAAVPLIKFHDLRHTFASWYMIEIGDIWMLKEILGHSDIQTTMKYAHCSQRHRRTPLDLYSKIGPNSGETNVLFLKRAGQNQ